MKKSEVELMIVGINMGKEQILNMKIYKDGTLSRSGCGGMPTFDISGMTIEGSKEYWEKLIPLVDEKIIENPINYQEEKITTPLEYFIAFFGVSSNGETGEYAKWTKTSGIRFLLDSNTSFNHPLVGFVDSFAINAATITNEWFFDIMMSAVYKLSPVGLGDTLTTSPNTDTDKQEALSRYVNQIVANAARGWDIVKIGNNRKYKTFEGKELISSVSNNAGQISINFMEVLGKDNIQGANKSLQEILAEVDKLEEQDKINAKLSKDLPDTKSSKNWWEFWK